VKAKGQEEGVINPFTPKVAKAKNSPKIPNFVAENPKK